MKTNYKKLIKLLQTEHNLILLDTDINDIEKAIQSDLKTLNKMTFKTK